MLFVVFVGCASHGDEQSRDKDCARVRDRMIELRLASVDGASGVDVAAHRRALENAVGRDLMSSCEKSMSAAQVKCVLAAKDAAAANACWSN